MEEELNYLGKLYALGFIKVYIKHFANIYYNNKKFDSNFLARAGRYGHVVIIL